MTAYLSSPLLSNINLRIARRCIAVAYYDVYLTLHNDLFFYTPLCKQKSRRKVNAIKIVKFETNHLQNGLTTPEKNNVLKLNAYVEKKCKENEIPSCMHEQRFCDGFSAMIARCSYRLSNGIFHVALLQFILVISYTTHGGMQSEE